MIIELPDELTISGVADLRDSLLHAWGSREPVQLDAQRLRTLDVAGAQLLWAAQRSARQSGRPLEFVGDAAGAVIDDTLRDLGLSAPTQVDRGE